MSDLDLPALRAYLAEKLQGRSATWLGKQLANPVTGSGMQSWLHGRTELKAWRADDISDALGDPRIELRRVAGISTEGVATSATWVDGVRVELPQPVDGIDFAKLSRDILDGTTPTPEPRDPAVVRIEQLHRQHARLLAELAAVGDALREATAPKP